MQEDFNDLDPEAAPSLWRAIIDDMPHMISVKDADTRRYIFCNFECQKILGPDAVGQTNFDVLDAVVAERIEAEETALINSGGVAIVESEVTDRSGHAWIMRTKKFVVVRPGSRRYLVTVSEDVSEKHEHSRRLDQAIQAADAANAAKSTFLATMSHEIRTPLNGVLGMAQAMAADELPRPQRQRLEIIQQSGQTLLVILNDILDVAKIEAGKLELEDGQFDIGDLLSSVQAPFAPLADQKGIVLSVVLEPSTAGVYRGDSVRVRQILYNLLSNAIKFTHEGGVRLMASRSADGLQIEVSDTGLGIPEDRAEHMFEKFTQADSTTTRRFGGTGLGLSICRELCLLMGGSISVASGVGKGTTFTVALPLQRAVPATDHIETTANTASVSGDIGGNIRILAAEDNVVNQLVLKTLLNQMGLDPVLVGDGRLAVEAWQTGVWDVILMDVQMPQMNGIDACKIIRQEELHKGRRRTPIIALTADTMDSQTRSYLEAGMDGYIPKPISAAQLFEALSQILASEEE